MFKQPNWIEHKIFRGFAADPTKKLNNARQGLNGFGPAQA